MATEHVRVRYRRDDTVAERLDRNYSEILQELRVAETGVQVLFAFLLGIAFQQRFAAVDDFQRAVFVITLIVAAISIALLIAPVAFHRIVFRRRMKDELVKMASLLAIAGTTFLLLAVLGSVLLVCDWVLNRPTAIAITAVLAVGVGTLWFAVPFHYRRGSHYDDGTLDDAKLEPAVSPHDDRHG
jgi:Family of unknown function (DUF6328)